MRVLIVSAETWRDDSNGGNVLSNLFDKLPYIFAQIYCNPDEPYNHVCKSYYQITDRDVLDSLIHRSIKTVGHAKQYEQYPMGEVEWQASSGKSKIYALAKRLRFESLYVAQEIAWGLAPLENNQLKRFVDEFDPDVIFAPCYASHRMLRLTRYLKCITGKPIISYISDDNYSLKQVRFSPIYWLNRIALRRHMRQTMPMYTLLYTMTEEQKVELEREFNIPIKVLRKHSDFSGSLNMSQGEAGKIRLIYAGGIYLNRWKTLGRIANAMARLNSEGGDQFYLDIYTNNEITKKHKVLQNCTAVQIHKAIPFRVLQEEYKKSDIAIHCESFDLKYKYDTRLSFSTKIIDCLHSGCAVLAIAWKRHSGLTYLKNEDAALCIDNEKDIESVLKRIKDNPGIIQQYAKKAWMCGRRNHNSKEVIATLDHDFRRIAGQ